MRCPFCDYEDTRVVETRMKKEEVGEVKRRRQCSKCQERFSTLEVVLKAYPFIIKKDGTREPFSEEKLKKGLQLACLKRPVSQATIEQTTKQLKKWLLDKNEKEVKSLEIGQKMMNKLKEIDNVAYIRFASVYKNFKDVDEFVKTLKQEEGPHEQKS